MSYLDTTWVFFHPIDILGHITFSNPRKWKYDFSSKFEYIIHPYGICPFLERLCILWKCDNIFILSLLYFHVLASVFIQENNSLLFAVDTIVSIPFSICLHVYHCFFFTFLYTIYLAFIFWHCQKKEKIRFYCGVLSPSGF